MMKSHTDDNKKVYILTGRIDRIKTSITNGQDPKPFSTAKFQMYLGRGLERKLVTRTIVATGEAYHRIEHLLQEGHTITIAAIFSHAPSTTQKRGGEFLTVVGLPIPPSTSIKKA